MKKFIKFLAIAFVALALVGCKAKPVAVVSQAKADYTEALAEVADSVETAFYEVEMVLDNPVSVLNEDGEVKIISTKTIIQEGPTCKMIDRLYSTKGKVIDQMVTTEESFWFGDFDMPLDSLVLDFADAIKKLQETNIVLPEADKVTLRKPASPPFGTYYIFGTFGTSFVKVNAITGEVTEDQPVEEETEEEVAE